MTDDQERLYRQLDAVIAVRGTFDQCVWTLFSIIAAAQAVLVVAITSSTNVMGFRAQVIAVSVVGVALALIWWSCHRRASAQVLRLSGLIATLERRLEVDPSVAISLAVNTNHRDHSMPRYAPHSFTIMKWTSGAATLAWLVVLAFGIVFL